MKRSRIDRHETGRAETGLRRNTKGRKEKEIGQIGTEVEYE